MLKLISIFSCCVRQKNTQIFQFFPFVTTLESPERYTYTNCIYILCEKSGNKITPIATAFAVKGTIALTAGHAVKGLEGMLCLTTKLEKEGNKIVSKDLIQVTVVESDANEDWAVLKRDDRKTFDETIPVATKVEELPTVGTKKKLTFYHCPVTLFTTQQETILHVTPKEGSVGLIGNKTIQFQNGGFDGSCGGPYVYCGKAVAIHVESINTALTPGSLKALEKSQGKRSRAKSTAETANLTSEMAVSTAKMALEMAESSASSHASNAGGITICAFPRLLEHVKN